LRGHSKSSILATSVWAPEISGQSGAITPKIGGVLLPEIDKVALASVELQVAAQIRSGVSSVAQCAWASPAGRQLTNALLFSQPVSISVERRWPLSGEQGCRLISSLRVIFDLSSANVDTRLCGVAKKTLTAITKHRILSFLLLRRTQRFEEYGRGSSTE
jgi:hypothetical protein